MNPIKLIKDFFTADPVELNDRENPEYQEEKEYRELTKKIYQK
jgi:hypothetical protein